MPNMESVRIGKSLFVFINGLSVGWFINNKPIFFSPQSNLEDKKERGGISAKPRDFGGDESKELLVGEKLQMSMTLEMIDN